MELPGPTFNPNLKKNKKIRPEKHSCTLGNGIFLRQKKLNKTFLNFLAPKKLNKTFLYSLFTKLPLEKLDA